MINETVVLTKLRNLPEKQQEGLLIFLEFLEYKTLATRTRQTVPKALLTAAAHALLTDYESDEELTAFTTLDGEAFHA
ncbi:MAG TPA: hypothetical protein PLD25_14735 [Chloroflexota bacterium]|nr:hypothetical protein [Chloroflexota bacterium]HUM67623.1 hypothetical protein [Chloroflexota bacterium]